MLKTLMFPLTSTVVNKVSIARANAFLVRVAAEIEIVKPDERTKGKEYKMEGMREKYFEEFLSSGTQMRMRHTF